LGLAGLFMTSSDLRRRYCATRIRAPDVQVYMRSAAFRP
jgi:hypothetical protein